jgi:glycyl-tRNA synthetase (class II)
MEDAAVKTAEEVRKNQTINILQRLEIKQLTEVSDKEIAMIPSPMMRIIMALALPGEFNLLFQKYVKTISNEISLLYMRSEIAKGIFINFQMLSI